jgi:hypothetical protein
MEKGIKTNQIQGFIGNQQVIDFFNYCLENSFPAQAFGVYGPRHIGKKHLLRGLLNSLDCVPGVNYFKISLEDGKRDLAIEQIRDWQKLMRMCPANGGYMIGVIEHGEALNSASANALLKIIEEPPKHVLIFICANSANSLLPTIQSRLFAVNLSAVNHNELRQGLLKVDGVREAQVNEVVGLAGGLPGLACKLLNEPDFFKQWQERVDEMEKVVDGNVSSRLLWLQTLFENKKLSDDFDPTQILSKLALVIGQRLEKNPAKYAHALAWLAEAPKLLKGNVNQRLLFEKIILSL